MTSLASLFVRPSSGVRLKGQPQDTFALQIDRGPHQKNRPPHEEAAGKARVGGPAMSCRGHSSGISALLHLVLILRSRRPEAHRHSAWSCVDLYEPGVRGGVLMVHGASWNFMGGFMGLPGVLRGVGMRLHRASFFLSGMNCVVIVFFMGLHRVPCGVRLEKVTSPSAFAGSLRAPE